MPVYLLVPVPLGRLQPCKAVKICHSLPSSELVRRVAASLIVLFDAAAQTEATQPGNRRKQQI